MARRQRDGRRRPQRGRNLGWSVQCLVRCSVVVSLVGAVLGGAAPALAQADAADDVRVGPVLDDDPPEVAAVLTPPADYSLLDLTADDVTVTRDGDPLPVRLDPLPASELEVAVIVDLVGGGAAAQAVRGAVAEVVRTLPGEASVTLVSSGTDPTVTAPLTTDRSELAEALAELDPPTGRSLGEAVAVSREAVGAGPGSRDAVVVISAAPLGVVLDSIREDLDEGGDQASLYLTGTGDVPPEDGLRGRITATGGALLSVSRPGALVGATDRISGDLANQYRLGVRLTSPGGGALTVRLDDAGLEPTDATLEVGRGEAATPGGAGSAAGVSDAAFDGGASSADSGPPIGWLVLALVSVGLIGGLVVLGLRRRRTAAPATPSVILAPATRRRDVAGDRINALGSAIGARTLAIGRRTRSTVLGRTQRSRSQQVSPGRWRLSTLLGHPSLRPARWHGLVRLARTGKRRWPLSRGSKRGDPPGPVAAGAQSGPRARAGSTGPDTEDEPTGTVATGTAGPRPPVISGSTLRRGESRADRPAVRFVQRHAPPAASITSAAPVPAERSGGDHQGDDLRADRPVVVTSNEELRAAERADAAIGWLDLTLGSLPDGFALDALVLRSARAMATQREVSAALWQQFRIRAGADPTDRSAEIERLVAALILGSTTARAGASTLLGPRPRLATESPSLRAALAWRAAEHDLTSAERAVPGGMTAVLTLLSEGALTEPVLELGGLGSQAPVPPDPSGGTGPLDGMLVSLATGARRTGRRLHRLVGVRDRAYGDLSGPRDGGAAALVDLMVANPILTISFVTGALDVTDREARDLIRWLESRRWLQCVGASGRGREFWVCPEVLYALDDGLDSSQQTDHPEKT